MGSEGFMIKNYFKIAFRNLIHHKAFAAINVAGLAIGMACSIFIFLWVTNEPSYDRFDAVSCAGMQLYEGPLL